MLWPGRSETTEEKGKYVEAWITDRFNTEVVDAKVPLEILAAQRVGGRPAVFLGFLSWLRSGWVGGGLPAGCVGNECSDHGGMVGYSGYCYISQ